MMQRNEAQPSRDSSRASASELASNQRMIWLGQQRYPEHPLYEVPHVFEIRGDVDPTKFQAAFEQLVNSTEILRTIARAPDWKQLVIQPSLQSPCESVSFETEPEDARRELASQYVQERIRRRLEPSEALYDSVLIRLSDAESWWFLRLHHLLTDGLNARQLLAAMSALYRGGDASPVRNKPQYSSFVRFESDTRSSQEFAEHIEWWSKRIDPRSGTRFYVRESAEETTSASSGLDFGVSRFGVSHGCGTKTVANAKTAHLPNPRSKTGRWTRAKHFTHRRLVIRLDDDESELIGELAEQTPFRQFTPALSHHNIFATAVATLLHRLEQDAKVRFGVTSHGRTNRRFRETIGLFMQLLPFEVDFDADDTFESVSRKVADETLGFLQHSVAGVMQPESAKAFDVVLNVLDLTVDDFAGMPATLRWLHNGYGDPARKLTISTHRLRETGAWEVIFDFNCGDFSGVQQDRLINHFRKVLREMKTPGAPIGSFPLDASQETALLATSSSPHQASIGETVWHRFVGIVEQYPDRIAMRGSCEWLSEGSSEKTDDDSPSGITFRVLMLHAERLAQFLDGPMTLVPVLCRRDANAVVSILAVLASGRSFLPIDLDQPQARIDTLLQDSNASLLIDASAYPRVTQLHFDANEIDCEMTRDACYVLYTSGSTGKPNGVVVGHQSILNLLDEFENLAPVSDGKGSWWTNVGFDVAIYEIFSSILYGRTLCIPVDDVRNQPEKLFSWMVEQKITNAYLPAFFLQAFSDFLCKYPESSLQRLLVGVEPIPQCVLASISRQVSGLQVINGYGPTEATVCATLMLVDESDDSVEPASIGRAVSGNVLRIVDPYGQVVPVGIPGELLIGGVGLARGYLRRPDLTQQRFQAIAGDSRSDVWYRTGDIVCLREDGNLLFRGRRDDQIKVRGHRIELGEVLSAIRSIDGVTDAVVVDLADDAGRNIFAAVVGEHTERSLRTRLADLLPRYMLPRLIRIVNEIPRTINGKPDIEAIRDAFDLSTAKVERVAASNPTEFTLLSIWQKLLRRSEIGVSDHFFEIGGDSLTAMQVVFEAEKLGISLRLPDLFEHPTVRELANEIRLDDDTTADPDHVGLQESNQYVLSPGQRSLWYLNQVDPDSVAYHVQIRLEMEGTLNTAKVQECFNELAKRHESLRTTFGDHDGIPYASVHPQCEIPFDAHDAATESQANSLCMQEGARRFDLQNGPLLRVVLIRFADDRSWVILTAHHIAVDQQSVQLLLTEFAQRYNEQVDHSVNTLAESSCGNSEPASGFARSKQEVRDRDGERCLSFWKSKLADISQSIDLPVDMPLERALIGNGGLHRFSISGELSQRLRELAKSHQVSLNTLLLTAFQTLLFRYCGEETFVIGVPVSHRHQLRFAETVGFLTETLPFPCSIKGDATFSDLLTNTDSTFTQCLGNLSASLDEIISGVRSIRTPAGRIPFQTMFVMQQPIARPAISGVEVTGIQIEHLGESKFDFTLFAVDAATLEFMIEYRSDLFSQSAVERMTEHWTRLLDEIAAEPATAIGRFDFLTDEDHRAIELCNRMCEPDMTRLPERAADFLVSETILDVIAGHVRRQPQAVAVFFEGQSLTFQELDWRTSLLSHRLIERGVESGEAVALCCERGIEMIVGIIGILKSGAAYVPADPRLPSARLQHIVNDATVSAIVTQEKYFESMAVLEKPVLNASGGFESDPETGGTPSVKPVVAAGDTAYVIYTSGSTGQPKGVEVTHRGLLKSTEARFRYYDNVPETFMLLSPVWFDSSIAGIFWTLAAGGTLVVPSEEKLRDIQALSHLIADQQVTHTLCLPSFYQLLLRHSEARSLGSLQNVIVAGEPCASTVIDEHFANLPDTRLFNEYGPTEATVWATARELAIEDSEGGVSIGSAVPGCEVRVLDLNGRDVPIGVVGEIHLGGTRLSKGYRGQPELTAERFVQKSDSSDSRFYRTGDLARLRSDGSLLFVGRVDDQMKINGQRVEPAEIESELSHCPGVVEIAVGFTESPSSISSDTETLAMYLATQPAEIAEALLRESEGHGGSAAPDVETFDHETLDVAVRLQLRSADFIRTPRDRQRNWLIQQALQESISDLNHLDRLAAEMVPGSEHPHEPQDLSMVRMSSDEIMEDWQTPLMREMANYACEAHGDVLEIGFGRGVAASFIQQAGVRSHTVIEMNAHCIRDFFVPWRARYPESDIRLIEGRWQENLNKLSTYDTVFFHAFPMNESEFVEYIANSATFAEHFFPTAAKLVRPGGVFTYLTTEIDSLSRRHQRSLFQHFDEIHQRVLPLSVPEDTKDAWWANSMVVLRALRGSR
ncbi:non-ribosomal peptide synthetase [Stieleria varia]|uniref:Linear gramicidin synthase subunit B n=1 Tax=Stieleria varia TaxID=2528005 RepID=A0A5C6B093_9BACT|nr:non-ribosomal peptide synthetase [Stieleria varia]TWU04991.1 Linear gramicidin synthase subunit B [Stieleria varia]